MASFSDISLISWWWYFLYYKYDNIIRHKSHKSSVKQDWITDWIEYMTDIMIKDVEIIVGSGKGQMTHDLSIMRPRPCPIIRNHPITELHIQRWKYDPLRWLIRPWTAACFPWFPVISWRTIDISSEHHIRFLGKSTNHRGNDETEMNYYTSWLPVVWGESAQSRSAESGRKYSKYTGKNIQSNLWEMD